MTDQDYRPAASERWIDGMRTEPATIRVRTEWLYSTSREALVPKGRTRHPFSRGGRVTGADSPRRGPRRSIEGCVSDAIAEFGDDKDLIIEIRLARPTDLESGGSE